VVAASVTVRVPAKVNLQLSVGPARADGYHELVTVFQAVNLCDEITARPNPGGGITLSMSGEGAEDLPTNEDNLAYRAALILAQALDVPADVNLHVRKAIPIAGGMAGGSADAAGTLLACDALWQGATSREQLTELAAALGSDVPFGLHGGNAIGTGRGERLTPVLSRGQFSWVFALADGGLSTPAVYRECDRLREGRPVADPYVSDMLMQALAAGDPEILGRALHNDLQPAALSLRPALDQLLAVGEDFGALGGLVSGSGPTCAFLARDEDHALDLAVALSGTGLCRSVRRAQGPVAGARITG
jgi:4-diphosphocytidyl-2-C-methyl-D-erythritol kinase